MSSTRKKTFQDEYIELLNKTELNLMRIRQRIGRPSRGLFGWHSIFPGLRAALRRFTPGYCSGGASGAQHRCINPSCGSGVQYKCINSSGGSKSIRNLRLFDLRPVDLRPETFRPATAF